MAKMTREKSEAKIQQEIVIWYTNNYCLKYHAPREIIFHVANEGQHRLVSQGLLPGVSDLILTHRGKMLFCEVKKLGEKQRAKQIEFQHRITELGYHYFLVYSLADFKHFILHLSSVNNEP